jgi:hypothetical protein
MNDLGNWKKWDTPLIFEGLVPRDIELHLNCSVDTEVWIKSFDNKQKEHVTFVGMCPAGKTELKLNVGAGDAEMFFVAEGQVWYYDPTARNVRRNSPEQRSFTTPPNRRERDPAVEKMMQSLQLSMVNQLRNQERKFQQQMDQLKAEQSNGVKVDPETGEVKEGDKVNSGATGTSPTEPTKNEDSGGTSGGSSEDGAGAGEGQGSDTSTPTEKPPATN